MIVFLAMRRQRRTAGIGGAFIGLDYAALPEVWRRTKTRKRDRDEVFASLQVIEDAAVAAANKVEGEG